MSPDPPAGLRRFLIADHCVSSDARARWLESFRDGGTVRRAANIPLTPGEAADPVYSGPGLAGGTVRDVRCRRSGSAFRLDVEGGCPLIVSDAGDQVVRLAPPGSAPTELDLELAFGAGLVLALGLRGVFCFHASCVRFGNRVAAFLGESGSGKSTIARLASRAPGRERVSDDVLPIVVSDGEVRALPRFPQLKLAPAEQWGADRPVRLSLDAIYDIGGADGEDGRPIPPRIRPLDLREAVLRLARRTVAARLFDASLTSRQLQACESIASRVPLRDLAYARVVEGMPAVFTAVEEDLDTDPAG